MGYGKRALKQLKNYYAGQFTSLSEKDLSDDEDGFEEIDDDEVGLLKETIAPRKRIPTLLKRLSERRPEKLDYIGTSYGITAELLKFWKSQKFVPVYLRYVCLIVSNEIELEKIFNVNFCTIFFFQLKHCSQKANDLTGEYSTIMISILKTDKMESDDWLSMYYCDFRRRLIKLLAKTFQSFTTGLALSLLDNKSVAIKNEREYNVIHRFNIEKII